jgi:hypothetical protein
VSFPAAGTILETLTAQTYPISEGGSYVTYNATNYPNQNADVYRKADGIGGDYLDWANAFNIQFKANGTPFYTYVGQSGTGNSVEVPSSSNNFYPSGYYVNNTYYHDGSGAYYTNGTGDYVYYTSGTLIFENVTSTNDISLPSATSVVSTYYGDRYTWNGFGSYDYISTWYVPNGTYIEFYDGYNYYHDGNGSYYQS